MATNERMNPLAAKAVEAAFRQHGPMTVATAAALTGYHQSAIYPIVKPPRYCRVRLEGNGGRRAATVWRLADNHFDNSAKIIFFCNAAEMSFPDARTGRVIVGSHPVAASMGICYVEPDDDPGATLPISEYDIFPYSDELWQMCQSYNTQVAVLSAEYRAIRTAGRKAHDLE